MYILGRVQRIIEEDQPNTPEPFKKLPKPALSRRIKLEGEEWKRLGEMAKELVAAVSQSGNDELIKMHGRELKSPKHTNEYSFLCKGIPNLLHKIERSYAILRNMRLVRKHLKNPANYPLNKLMGDLSEHGSKITSVTADGVKIKIEEMVDDHKLITTTDKEKLVSIPARELHKYRSSLLTVFRHLLNPNFDGDLWHMRKVLGITTTGDIDRVKRRK